MAPAPVGRVSPRPLPLGSVPGGDGEGAPPRDPKGAGAAGARYPVGGGPRPLGGGGGGVPPCIEGGGL